MRTLTEIRRDLAAAAERLRPVFEALRSLTQAIGNALLPQSFCPRRELGGSHFMVCKCGKCHREGRQA